MLVKQHIYATTSWTRAVLIGALLMIGLMALGGNAQAACPNEAFRVGPSAGLPDCRAYELVTPPDSNGRLFIGPTSDLPFDQFPIELFSPQRESLLYMTLGTPIPELEEPNGTYDLYQAQRLPSGWQTTRRLSPSGPQALIPNAGGVSSNHDYAFVHVSPLASTSGGSFGDEGSAGYLGNPDGSFELIGTGSLGVERLVQGRYISLGGEHVIFTTGGNWCLSQPCPTIRLEQEAPPSGTPAIYDRAPDGPTRVVSLLPGNVTPAAGQAAEYQGASADGTVVAFKLAGALYVRIDNTLTRLVTSGPATFAGLSQDGGKLFYENAGNVYAFDVSSGATTAVNGSGDAELVNISADGSHVYFISPSLLDGPEGQVGKPNLYVWKGGATNYIATVLQSDLERTSGKAPNYPALANWTDWVVTPDRTKSEVGVGPGGESSRLTPDGDVLVFESRAQLTGYDNQGHTEIYRYDDLEPGLECVSCNPDGVPATADARFQELEVAKPWVTIHNLSADGSRVFFETAESLKGDDINEANDVYEWQLSEGDAALELISSGESHEYPPLIVGPLTAPRPNVLLGISPSGSDVAFIALDRLVPQGPGGGSPAIYDARIGGGFPEPSPSPACLGADACRGVAGVPSEPSLPTFSPSSADGNSHVRRHPCRRFHGKRKSAKHRACHRRHSKARGRSK